MKLDIEHLTVRYGVREALRDVSFQLRSGQVLAVIGPNGAGKSTLIRVLSGVIPAQSGRALLDGTDLARLSPSERARHIAVVPQARSLPPDFTGYETVMLGRTPHLNWLGRLSPADEAAIQRAIERTRTGEFAARRVGELSGGEQQRLLLARALAQEAPLLLMDEPTTHLDLKFQISLMETTRDLAHAAQADGGHAVLVVMHDLHLVARYADVVILLVNGGIRAAGSPAEVLTPEVLAPAYDVPAEAVQNLSTD